MGAASGVWCAVRCAAVFLPLAAISPSASGAQAGLVNGSQLDAPAGVATSYQWSPNPRLSAPTFISPNDARITYTEYVNADISAGAAMFDRSVIPATGSLHSPGTRINFSSDARVVRMAVVYFGSFAFPEAGSFRIEVDGVLREASVGEYTGLGPRWFTLDRRLPPATTPRSYSVIFPYASWVAFAGLELTGGQPFLLDPPPPRPSFRYVAYGDSITHGFRASSTSHGYPTRVADLRGWSVVNMGFFGRKVASADGNAVGALNGDLVTVAIGVNDFLGAGSGPTSHHAFVGRYNNFLDQLRALQPSVPVVVITPTLLNIEEVPNSLGLKLEDYRHFIRDVVAQRTPSDPALHLVEGPLLVPAGLAFFEDGIHPTDAGFALYASSLDAFLTSTFGPSGPPPLAGP